MVTMINEKLSLVDIVRREVGLYAGNAQGIQHYTAFDDDNQLYAVVAVPENANLRPTWVPVMARIMDGIVIIDEDTSVDKPLYQALMVNGGIPREKIVLAYKGETLPADPLSRG